MVVTKGTSQKSAHNAAQAATVSKTQQNAEQTSQADEHTSQPSKITAELLAAVPPQDVVTTKRCSSCKQELPADECPDCQNEDVVTGSTKQCRCKPCSKMFSRFVRLDKARGCKLAGFNEVRGGERAQFMRDNQDLFGADLEKAMLEAVTNIRLTKQTNTSRAQFNFIPIEGDDGVKVQYADKPEQLANILDNAPRIRCAVEGIELVGLPKYSLDLTDEQTESEERKRKFEAEFTIKKAKKLKEEPKEKAKQEPEGDQPFPPAAKMVPLTDAQKARAGKMIPVMEDFAFKLNSAMVSAGAHDCQQFIAPILFAKAKETESDLTAIRDQICKLDTAGECAKGHATDVFKQAAKASSDVKAIMKKLEEVLEEAKTAAAPAK